MSSWLTAQRSGTETWAPHDLQEGDLIFSQKSGDLLSALGSAADEPWRHVGSLTRNEIGELVVVEILDQDFALRTLDQFLTAYESYGAARLDLPPECVESANAWMRSRIGAPHVYANDDLVLAGVMAATQRGIFLKQPERVRSALFAAAERCRARLPEADEESYTCSGFVQIAYADSRGGCGIMHPRWRSVISWPPRLGSIDELFDDADLQRLFGDASLLELLAVSEQVERGGDVFPTRADQLGEAVRVLAAAIVGFAAIKDPTAIGSDGRWVTPGDLWRSPTVLRRATLAL